MTTVRPISYSILQFGDTGPALIAEYAAECGNAAIGAADPQWAMYDSMQAAGMMQAFGLFDAHIIVGFAVVLSAVLPHYGRKVANVESLFVSKPYRCTAGVGKLLQAVEQYAEFSAGCAAILYSAPAGSRLEETLERRYERTNAVFCRPLGAHA